MGTQEEHTVPFSWEESRPTGLLEYSLQIQAAAATEQLLATLNSILIMHLILFFLKKCPSSDHIYRRRILYGVKLA